ncbi:hypothetical protein PPO43_06525 [Saprospira sp. CCB-QB6]|uniref:hypothetical protein n=1 Tax=Saprospira sp. CCB-QB6 TaxID=3023936 RepID=UPI00234A5FC4|nr:hypothetical protein [Saprospira sp. CCB-QB6]WCL82745.1 hypothetical protein PPO43_06525 [Saprospira sp. CCB-QB6]
MDLITKKFFKLFWQSEECRTIFLQHRTELLEKEVDLLITTKHHYMPRIFITNINRVREDTELLIFKLEEEELEVNHFFEEFAKNYLVEEQIKTYLQSKFPKGMQLIPAFNLETPNNALFQIAQKIFEDWQNEVPLGMSITKHLINTYLLPTNIQFENFEDAFNYFENMVIEEVKSINLKNALDLREVVDTIVKMYNYKFKRNLYDANLKFGASLLPANKKEYKKRLALLDALYDFEVLSGGHYEGHYECVECKSFKCVSTTDIKPSKNELKCPNCGSKMLHIVPYRIYDKVHEKIVQNDGLLAGAIEYLLDLKGQNYTKNGYIEGAKDVELDFIIKCEADIYVTEVLEIKMFKNKDFDALKTNLLGAIAKIKKAKDKLVKLDEGWKEILFSVITNVRDEEVLKTAKKEAKSDLEEYKIKFFTPMQFLENHD